MLDIILLSIVAMLQIPFFNSRHSNLDDKRGLFIIKEILEKTV